MKDLVSIIVPIYNVENQIKGCVESLINQTYKNIEVLLVNDGSTDHSVEDIEPYLSNQVVLISQENGGAANARNNGLIHASGEYIVFIDGDDRIDLTFIEKMHAKMIEGYDLVVCDYIVENYDGENEEIISLGLSPNESYSLSENPYLINSIGNAPWNKMFRKDIIAKNKLIFPEKYRHHDLVFTQLYLLNTKNVTYINIPLNYYLKDRPNNISTSYDSKIDHILIMLDEVIKAYKDKKLFEIYYEELKYLACSNITLSLKKIRNINSKEFVYNYIDRVFKWYDLHFPDYKKGSYYIELCLSDKLYMNKFLLKSYYLYLRIKK